ncbi:MAG: type II toxin-antitoxin system HicB family antitoxin [Clostridia bacterium]|nr:type II toxin-antitoxin system HicB family antitoxin [Clostridia bacterium]
MTLEDYLKLPYTKIVQEVQDENVHYFSGDIVELEMVLNNLQEALVDALETNLNLGREIPLPITEENYSGKFLIRMPRSLHRRLAIEAKKEGVSLNQYAIYKLSR